MPGYPVLEIDKQNLDDKFLCEYCQSVLRDATRASCGHFFCSSCVKNLFRDNPAGVIACSRTGTPLFHYQFSFDGNFCDKVLGLIVHCLFLETGCRWNGKLKDFEDHVQNCGFRSCSEKKMARPFEPDEMFSQLEAMSKINKVSNDEQCGHCKAQVNADLMKFHQSQECPEIDDEIPQAKKERQVNYFLPNKNSPENSMEFYKGENGPSLAAGNCDTRITSTGNVVDFMDHERRLNDVENKVAQHDLVLRENVFLKQHICYLTDTVLDISKKVHHIQCTLEFQERKHVTFQENLNALQSEQMNLQARFNRLLESPLSQAELARLNRSMEVIQRRIARLDQYSRSHGGMLANLANSVTALADQVSRVRPETAFGVDIERV